jgi:hypothetical protein
VDLPIAGSWRSIRIELHRCLIDGSLVYRRQRRFLKMLDQRREKPCIAARVEVVARCAGEVGAPRRANIPRSISSWIKRMTILALALSGARVLLSTGTPRCDPLTRQLCDWPARGGTSLRGIRHTVSLVIGASG